MKRKARRPRPCESGGTPDDGGGTAAANRGGRRKSAADHVYHGDAATNSQPRDAEKLPETQSKASGRLSCAVCRLCHGKFSPRSLRHAFHRGRSPDSVHGDEDDDDDAADAPSPVLLFHTDFQRLVGVPLNRDPRLSDFICKKCHAKFYKCHGVLRRFLQRVNLPVAAAGKENATGRKGAKSPQASEKHGSLAPPSFSSDSSGLHSLVSWAHRHGEAGCRSCPDLKEVLKGRCWGSVRAVWGCVDGHRYVMDTRGEEPGDPGSLARQGEEEEEEEQQEQQDEEPRVEKAQVERPSGNGRVPTGSRTVPHRRGTSAAPAPDDWGGNTGGPEETASPAAMDDNLSDRLISEDDFEESGKVLSDDELFEPYTDRRGRRVNVSNKRSRVTKVDEEPKIKKKPGPKPGWKNQFKPKGEELPNIYKCPYQGCTAVYRAPDGLKKHIKEHHEEVRERPCPHPGCNKVFMIDRYLQRHVKLIHTEERNYICDQCGQTFKQRKHLSVHQMRHSGVKPLQCEVCGFQCRQRASLKYHMTKHKAEAELEFACVMCGKRFEKAHNLNVHMSMVHPVIQTQAQRGGGQQQAPPPAPPPPPYAAAPSAEQDR